MRIIPQALWDRAKARQQRHSQGIGALVRGGLRRRAAGAGRPARHLFSGLLSCAVCEAAFVLRNRTCYCCATHWNGLACSNTINVSRDLVRDVMLAGIREDLRDPIVTDEIERRLNAALRRQQQPATAADHKRIAQLQTEVDNATAAIMSGLLSPALRARLEAAEAELARLQSQAQPVRRSTAIIIIPNVRGRIASWLDRLDDVLTHDTERGRAELRTIFSERIKLVPDESGKFLWADYSLGLVPLLSAGSHADLMVAGARSGRGIRLI